MTTPAPIYHLALREFHAGKGATFGVHAGWAMPLSYTGPTAECEALRGAAVAFDRSNRSRILVTGADGLDVLKAAFAGHVEDLEEGRAMRTARLDADGNIADLCLIARTGGVACLVVGEPGQRFETLTALRRAAAADFDARVEDRTESTCLIGLAGPTAAQVVREHLADALPSTAQTLHCVAFEFHGFRALAIRTSDTGEDGFELMLAPAVAQHVFETLTGAGLPMAGRQALEIARVEACIPAFEPDLAPGLSPAEADLDVLLEIPGGREGRILAGLLVEGDLLAPGTAVAREGAVIGQVTSAVHSPGLNATIALGIIDVRFAFPGQAVQAGECAATVVAKPFFRRRT